jgi:hypothetical protein
MLEDSATMAPDELLARLIRLFPDFGDHWDGPDNDEREPDGSFTLRGAFTEFSLYFSEHYEELSPQRLQGLSWLLL